MPATRSATSTMVVTTMMMKGTPATWSYLARGCWAQPGYISSRGRASHSPSNAGQCTRCSLASA